MVWSQMGRSRTLAMRRWKAISGGLRLHNTAYSASTQPLTAASEVYRRRSIRSFSSTGLLLDSETTDTTDVDAMEPANSKIRSGGLRSYGNYASFEEFKNADPYDYDPLLLQYLPRPDMTEEEYLDRKLTYRAIASSIYTPEWDDPLATAGSTFHSRKKDVLIADGKQINLPEFLEEQEQIRKERMEEDRKRDQEIAELNKKIYEMSGGMSNHSEDGDWETQFDLLDAEAALNKDPITGESLDYFPGSSSSFEDVDEEAVLEALGPINNPRKMYPPIFPMCGDEDLKRFLEDLTFDPYEEGLGDLDESGEERDPELANDLRKDFIVEYKDGIPLPLRLKVTAELLRELREELTSQQIYELENETNDYESEDEIEKKPVFAFEDVSGSVENDDEEEDDDEDEEEGKTGGSRGKKFSKKQDDDDEADYDVPPSKRFLKRLRWRLTRPDRERRAVRKYLLADLEISGNVHQDVPSDALSWSFSEKLNAGVDYGRFGVPKGENKAVVQIDALKLNLNEDELLRLRHLCGNRYNPGAHQIRLVCRQYSTREDNARRLMEIIRGLVEEAKNINYSRTDDVTGTKEQL